MIENEIADTCDNLVVSSSYVSELERRLREGVKFPFGKESKQLIYSSYFKDIDKAQRIGLNNKIPKHDGIKFVKDSSLLRVMTFNIHFWREVSETVNDDTPHNIDHVLNIVHNYKPDVILLQEIPMKNPEDNTTTPELSRIQNAGYKYISLAPSSKCHFLPDTFGISNLSNSELRVAICSKIPFHNFDTFDSTIENIPDSGCAIGRVIEIPTDNIDNLPPKYIGFVSIHLSVKCTFSL